MKKIILTSEQGPSGRRRIWVHHWYHQSIGTTFISPLVQHGHHIDISNQRDSCFPESSQWFFLGFFSMQFWGGFILHKKKNIKRRRKNKKVKGKQFVHWDNVFHAGLFFFFFSLLLFFCICYSKYKTTHYMVRDFDFADTVIACWCLCYSLSSSSSDIIPSICDLTLKGIFLLKPEISYEWNF